MATRETADLNHSRVLTGPAPTPDPENIEDAIYVPLLSATGSMGPGSELMTEDVVLGNVPLSRRWLSLHLPRHRPQALRLVHAYGDSMLGTLNSGDFALVDTDIRAVDVDGVYVLEAHQRLFIKRVRQRLDGAYEVSSDNPAIKQSDVLSGKHEVRVCGRVVYGWNGRRF
ncbi:helix-turn-helix transcriptional regulator [Comamonas sp. J-3]|uniref:S24 family peptidase n=1 Tax=Comamonas trifloxystrobinivorans TaxID=3350256 RepID=UPI003728C8ED